MEGWGEIQMQQALSSSSGLFLLWACGRTLVPNGCPRDRLFYVKLWLVSQPVAKLLSSKLTKTIENNFVRKRGPKSCPC